MIYNYKLFADSDIKYCYNQSKVYPLWHDFPVDSRTVPESVLSTFYLNQSEVSNDWESHYYYNLYAETASLNSSADVQFSVAFGSSIRLDDTTILDTNYLYSYPSYAIYRQMVNVLLDGKQDTKFTLPTSITSRTSNDMDYIYVISISKNANKGGIEKGTWQLNLSGSGTYYDTGTNSDDSTAYSLVNLINYGGSDGSTNQLIIGGTASLYNGAVNNSLRDVPFGWFYPDKGIFILDAKLLDINIGKSGYNQLYHTTEYTAFSLDKYKTTDFNYISNVLLYNITSLIQSGSYFKAFSNDKLTVNSYYCNVASDEFLNTNNPSAYNSSSKLLQNLYDDPTTYITKVGLYDGDINGGNLVAVAKLSRPVKKKSDTELKIKINLNF